MTDVIVIGAGIGGLTLGYELQQAGIDTVVVDSAPSAGGVIRTEQQNGFLLEHGPNSTMTKAGLRCLVEKLQLGEELVGPQVHAHNRFLGIRTQSGETGIEAAPTGLRQAISTPILSLRGKARLLAEPLVGKRLLEDESVYSFIARRLGLEICENIVAPLLSGVWAADLKTLSCRSALPLIWSFEKEHRSIIWGGIRHMMNRRKTPRTRSMLVSFLGGMSRLPQALTAALKPGSLLLNTPVIELQKAASGIRVHCSPYNSHASLSRINPRLARSSSSEHLYLEARQVVIAATAPSAGGLINHFDHSLAKALGKLPYAPLGVLHLAYRRHEVQHPLNGFGFLLPPKLGHSFLGAIFNSSLFPGRADDNHHLITCFCGGAATPHFADIEDPLLRSRVIHELGALIQAAGVPRVLSYTLWQQSIPNYPLGHFKLQQALRKFENENPQITFLGAWDRGISVADRIEEAGKLANELAAKLREGLQTQL